MRDETPAERVSRFHEHTNTTSSICAPPAELWKDVAIDGLLDKFTDENAAAPAVRRAKHPRRIMAPTGHRRSPAARTHSDAATVATAEGTFGRFSRAVAHVFGVLGKRKAGPDAAEPAPDAAQAALDERKRAAEEAYHLAKAQGLLPAPKVFVRPALAPRAWSADGPATATPRPARADGSPRPRPPLAPRTPGSVARSPSKRDLSKQKRLSKRVSSLEVKLASAKKDLQAVLGTDCLPVVPPLPALDALPAQPNTPRLFSDDAPRSPAFGDGASASLPGKITKKRKTAAHDGHGIETETETDPDPDALPLSPVPTPSRPLHRRLSRRLSRSSVRAGSEEHAVVVKPGGAVPPVPAVPRDVAGKKVRVVGDDGYGGLGHEMF